MEVFAVVVIPIIYTEMIYKFWRQSQNVVFIIEEIKKKYKKVTKTYKDKIDQTSSKSKIRII